MSRSSRALCRSGCATSSEFRCSRSRSTSGWSKPPGVSIRGLVPRALLNPLKLSGLSRPLAAVSKPRSRLIHQDSERARVQKYRQCGLRSRIDSEDIGCLDEVDRVKGVRMSRITAVETRDVRFPTSRELDGSDAMNVDPDYSAAYVRISTDSDDGLEGSAFVFTIGRGNDVEVAAINALAPMLVGRDSDALLGDMGGTWRSFVYDSQLRWLGPEKGVMHMAIGAVINALWDLKAKRAGLPLWQLLSRMSPEELVDLVDFRYLTDAITPEDAL